MIEVEPQAVQDNCVCPQASERDTTPSDVAEAGRHWALETQAGATKTTTSQSVKTVWPLSRQTWIVAMQWPILECWSHILCQVSGDPAKEHWFSMLIAQDAHHTMVWRRKSERGIGLLGEEASSDQLYASVLSVSVWRQTIHCTSSATTAFIPCRWSITIPLRSSWFCWSDVS